LPASSVSFHGLGDDRIAEGMPLEDVLSELLALLAGRIVIAHHAALDIGFIAAACRRLWHSNILLPCIDTLPVVRELAQRHERSPAIDALTLPRAGEQFDLPSYPRQDALWDAIAAAELWLALQAELAPTGRLGLERFVRFLP
jgi:DNA polymerase-3 subunit epsilon